VVERLRSDGVVAEGEVRLLGPGEKVGPVVASTATKEEADLVAIGSRGRSDLGALFLGSVSNAVAGRLHAPMLVLRASSTPAEPRTVLVAVDGSAGSDEAVAEAAEVAAAFRASVFVLHVRQLVAVQGAAIVEPEEEATAMVRRAVAAVEARGVRVTGEVVIEHSVASAVVSAAERYGADLVVLGSRRPSHLGGLVLGSVAHDVIHRLRCPVLLARRVPQAESVG
jgi:nucleotide-binding universal stress UspA family protein